MLVIIASLVLMTLDHRHQRTDSLRSVVSYLIYPIQFLSDLPFATKRTLLDGAKSQQDLVIETARLKAQALIQSSRLQRMAALEAENVRLRELLESSFMVGDRVLIAELYSVAQDPASHKVVTNKGALNDIYRGQPVLDANGVAGQVVHVNNFTSTVILISDPNHAIPVRINRNGLRTIALGTGNFQELRLPHLPNNSDVRVGDLLVTSGLGERFPPGYPVATISNVEQVPGRAFASITATPTAALQRLQEVLFVWHEPQPSSMLEENTESALDVKEAP